MTEVNKGGRPTKYNPEMNEIVTNYCLLGATEEDLARFLDVSTSTITNWKNEYPEFLASIKKGKEQADSLVAKSLFKRAIGYRYKEIKNEESENGIKDTVTDKEVPPDTTAQIFWLKNRQPKLWRDKQVTEIEGSVTIETKSMEDIFK